VLGITAVGLVVYFRNEKEKLQLEKEKREREKIKRLGKPNIGSPFKLYNVNEDRIQS
jgi:protein SCO1/2